MPISVLTADSVPVQDSVTTVQAAVANVSVTLKVLNYTSTVLANMLRGNMLFFLISLFTYFLTQCTFVFPIVSVLVSQSCRNK